MKLMPTTRFGVVWRGLLAFVVVVGCAAGATATAGLLKFKSIADVINLQKPLQSKELVVPPPGAPQTMLLVGVDHRYHEGDTPGNTDTMMLVRVNDRSSTINMLSIPRDIQVDVPGYGAEKLNAAYSEGGPDLLIKTIKADVFPHLQLNQLLLVDFSSFANLINAIGCVYAQVDHRYYNHSIGLADPTTDYSSIDIQPGYQRLCGGSRQRPRRGQHGAGVRALPPQRLGLRARVASAGLPALGKAELQRRQAALEPDHALERLRQRRSER